MRRLLFAAAAVAALVAAGVAVADGIGGAKTAKSVAGSLRWGPPSKVPGNALRRLRPANSISDCNAGRDERGDGSSCKEQPAH